MTSSCGAYHQEALRRQRVVDRKRAADKRLEVLKEDEEKKAIEKQRIEEEEKQKRQDDKMRELQEHLNAVKGNSRRSSRKKGIPTEVLKEINAKGKILRNSNLLIGHSKALWEAK